MKPLISDEERIQTVRNFLVARFQKRATIISYKALVPFLTEKRIKILCKLEMSGLDVKRDYYGNVQSRRQYYIEDDAAKYFEWLVAVVNGTEDATETLVKQANDQLFRLIHVMNEDIEQDEDVQLIAPYDWQKLFLSFDKKLIDVKNTIDRRDKDIVDILKSISTLLKEYKIFFKTLQKDYERYFPKSDTS